MTLRGGEEALERRSDPNFECYQPIYTSFTFGFFLFFHPTKFIAKFAYKHMAQNNKMHQKLLEHTITTGEKNDPSISFKLLFFEFEPNQN